MNQTQETSANTGLSLGSIVTVANTGRRVWVTWIDGDTITVQPVGTTHTIDIPAGELA